MTMRQAVMTAPGVIEFHEVDKPGIDENQVQIQVKKIGVCGSDIHVYHGLHPYTTYPVVQGHEVAGTISEIGRSVSGFRQGDQVVFMPQVTCGTCYPCRHGMDHICDSLKVMGFQTGGAAQDFIAIDSKKVLKVPGHVPADQAAMIEPIAVAVHALSRAGQVKDMNILVLGAGTIGNLVGQSARALGARAVMITDISEYKREQARLSGLDFVVDAAEDLDPAIIKNFGRDRADLILECVGVQETITQAVSNARKGSTIVVVGVFGKKPQVDLGLVQDREISLIGTLMYQRKDYEKAIELVSNGKLMLEKLISRHYAFNQYPQAYRDIDLAHGNLMKVMIDL
jgi:L-iditol 2-dehydrogenase